MMWPLLQLDPVAQGLPCGSSAYPLDHTNLSHRVEGGWLILQQSLSLGDFLSFSLNGEISCRALFISRSRRTILSRVCASTRKCSAGNLRNGPVLRNTG